MNKNNFNHTGFEVNGNGYRRSIYSGRPFCGCSDEKIVTVAHAHKAVRAENHDCGRSDGCYGKENNGRYGLHDRPVGSVYAPLQNFDCLYDLERALCRGTLFSDLDLPLEVASKGGCCRG
jgi:hypothetical protein